MTLELPRIPTWSQTTHVITPSISYVWRHHPVNLVRVVHEDDGPLLADRVVELLVAVQADSRAGPALHEERQL